MDFMDERREKIYETAVDCPADSAVGTNRKGLEAPVKIGQNIGVCSDSEVQGCQEL